MTVSCSIQKFSPLTLKVVSLTQNNQSRSIDKELSRYPTCPTYLQWNRLWIHLTNSVLVQELSCLIFSLVQSIYRISELSMNFKKNSAKSILSDGVTMSHTKTKIVMAWWPQISSSYLYYWKIISNMISVPHYFAGISDFFSEH